MEAIIFAGALSYFGFAGAEWAHEKVEKYFEKQSEQVEQQEENRPAQGKIRLIQRGKVVAETKLD